jgi:hypothetical protein
MKRKTSVFLFLLASNKVFVLPTEVDGGRGFMIHIGEIDLSAGEIDLSAGDFTFSNGSCGETP